MVVLSNFRSFDTDTNTLTFITQENLIDLGAKSKMELAFEVLDESRKLENRA